MREIPGKNAGPNEGRDDDRSRSHGARRPPNFPSSEQIDRIPAGSGRREQYLEIKKVIMSFHPGDNELFHLIREYPDDGVRMVLAGLYADRHIAEWNGRTMPLGEALEKLKVRRRFHAARSFRESRDSLRGGGNASPASLREIIDRDLQPQGVAPRVTDRVKQMRKAIDEIMKAPRET